MPCWPGKTGMRLLLFNLVTDVDDPVLGFATRWIAALARRVEFIDVITMRAGRTAAPTNVRVHSVGKEKGYSELRRVVEFYRHVWRTLREERFDVCFSHMIPIFSVLAAPLLKRRGIPIVTWYAHPSLTPVLKVAHFVSRRMVTSLESAYPYRPDKLVAVGQGVDSDLFTPDSVYPEPPVRILCVGRLSPIKDHPTLLKAAATLRQQMRIPLRITLVGGPASPMDEAYVRHLHQQAQAHDLQDIVRFEPPVPHSTLPTWYRRCTVHVNLTPTGSGDKVALEAMSCGRPSLVSNEGFSETLGQYRDYLLFRYADSEDLAYKIKSILDLPSNIRHQIGSELRENVIRKHSLDRLVDCLVDIFSEVRCNVER
jgi:glycosyltransferase involved in cell wall biosynthesis